MEDGAHLANKGVFEANAEPVCDSSEISIRAHKVTGEPEPVIVNTGTFKKTEGTGTTDIAAPFENHGTVEAAAGALELTDGGSGNSEGKWAGSSGSSLNLKAGTFALTGGVLEGAVQIVGATITAAGSIEGSASNLTVSSGTFTAESGSSTSVGTFKMSGGTINGSGNLSVSSSFSWSKGTMSGTGSTVVDSGASGTIDGCLPTLIERTLTNDGTTNFTGKGSEILMEDGAHLANKGVFEANAEPVCDSSEISISSAPLG